MDNPLEQSAPADTIDRVREFARDLAYGVARGYWGTRFSVVPYAGGRQDWEIFGDEGHFRPYVSEKWAGEPPNIDILLSFEYVVVYEEKQYHKNYMLTGKSFQLLEAPYTAPSVFISYRRKEASALALLVEARLKLADRDNDVFVDKDIPIGEDWEAALRDRVASSRYFVSLIGPSTLESEHVQDEITWALEADRKIITMTLPGFNFQAYVAPDDRVRGLIEQLSAIQSIPVKSESAEDYDSAVRKLLNTLGYSTL